MTSDGSQNITAFFFYGDGCTHCDSVKPLLAELEAKYPRLNLVRLEVYHNVTNQQTLERMGQEYAVPALGVPTIFIGNHSLAGDTEIREHFEETIVAELASPTSCPNATVPGSAAASCGTSTAPLSPALVITSALVDSINPCAFSVLIFLLISVVPLRNRRRILTVGGIYIAAVFVFYFVSGLGLLTVVHVSGISTLLAVTGGIVAIALGIISLADISKNEDHFLLSIPASRKAQIEEYIRRATLPAAFVLGILVGLFELPCTGGIYLAILGLMSTQYTVMEGIPWLLLYNAFFVLPLVLLLLLVAFGLPPAEMDAWRVRHRRLLRGIVGIAMILLGIFIFWSLLH